MSQLRHIRKELDKQNIVVKVITFDGDALAAAYVENTKFGWPLIQDTELKLYSAYGMKRGSWWDIYHPVSVWRYLRLIFTGKGPGKPGRDWKQLGGDVLIDPDGIIRLHHVSSDPHDRPSVEEILKLTMK